MGFFDSLIGMPRDEIVKRGLLYKQIPLYGALGYTGLYGENR